MCPRKRRDLERMIGIENSATGIAWLALHRLRATLGKDETGGFELALLRAIAWRRLGRRRVI